VAARPRPKPELGSFGVELEHRKLTVAAGDDFYRFANGTWLDEYQLKPDETSYGSFVKLVYRSEDQLRAIVDELSRAPAAPGSPEQQLRDYFASWMDAARLEKLGLLPLADELGRIAHIDSREKLVDALGSARAHDNASPLELSISIDRRDPDRYWLELSHGGLGLPERSYYLEDAFKPVVAAYRAHVAQTLVTTGVPAARAARDADAVVALETSIARAHWPSAELRELDKTTNVLSLAAFEAQYPGYPFRRHLRAAGLDPSRVTELNVTTPSAFKPLMELVNRTPLATWRSYLTFHLLAAHAPLLGDTLDNQSFGFFGKVLGGQQQQRERWKRGMQLIGGEKSLGEALGRLYVARHFPPTAQAQMSELVENLRAAFKQRLEQLDWMGPDTKREAFQKLATFNPKIGYPKKWRDLSRIAIRADDLLGNYRRIRDYWYTDEIERLGKPTDRDEWAMTPQTVNAYYNPSFNEIVFPAAILQPPFFDPNADPAVNYGSIGAVIGHEMGHGFDDQGSKSDARGVQRNWWTAQDRARFEARTGALVLQYGAYEPLPGQHVDGRLTLGENIGDLGGVAIAHAAYRRSLGNAPAPVLDGTTGDQRFFLGWAQVWAAKQRDEVLLRALKSNPHSPPAYRVNGVVRNLDAWYDAFGVKQGDALFLPPAARVRIW
jgi:putative endopeptidase